MTSQAVELNYASIDRLTAPQPQPGEMFGSAVDASGDLLAVGSPGSQSVHLYEQAGDTWVPLTTLEPPQPVTGFGEVVVLDGGIVLVASRSAAYVFESGSGTWTMAAMLETGDDAPGSGFGRAIALSQDTAVVGAFRDHAEGTERTGAVYVFERDAGAWSQTAKLTAAIPADGARFGWSVALDEGAHRLAVGAPGAQSVEVFERDSGGSWASVATLETPEFDDSFGRSVSVSGGTVAVGAPFRHPKPVATGVVHLFEQDSNGEWEHAGAVHPGDVSPLEMPGRALFGLSLDLSGSVLIVGAPRDDASPGHPASPSTVRDEVCFNLDWLVPTCARPGAAYVFERDGSGWSQTSKLTAPDARPLKTAALDNRDLFGWGVTISPDDQRAIVGAPRADEVPEMVQNAGAVYVFGSLRVGGS